MRCSCRVCGTYMVQDEKGLSSRCICPQCFATCSACMGTIGEPLDLDSLRFVARLREAEGDGDTRTEFDDYGKYE